jgi:hypothetical protein
MGGKGAEHFHFFGHQVFRAVFSIKRPSGNFLRANIASRLCRKNQPCGMIAFGGFVPAFFGGQGG